jgi:hypothetical protein
MPTTLQEFTAASAAHLRVDRDAGVLHGVKLLGLVSSNGRRYLQSALREAAPLYEGAKVNVNHATGAKGGAIAPREYQDRLGVIRHVAFREGEGLFGDLHFNPKHALAEQLVWDAEHAPQNVGLSHNVLAHTAGRGDQTIVERIEKVQSVDLVADPATTRGLFECGIRSAECGMKTPQAELPTSPHSEFRTPHSEEFVRRARRIFELLAEHKLPLPGAPGEAARQITSDAFLDALWRAVDEDALRQQVAERAALVEAARSLRDTPACTSEVENPAWTFAQSGGFGNGRPTSRDQFAAALGVPAVAEPNTTKSFVESITRC